MNELFLFPSAARRHPSVEAWLAERHGELGTLARHWFSAMRGCGNDVRELLHDGHPTACVGEAAFAYVDQFKAHINVGFYRGVELPDPGHLLEGTGKRMRHVKVRPDVDLDAEALVRLIEAAYADMKNRLASVQDPAP